VITESLAVAANAMAVNAASQAALNRSLDHSLEMVSGAISTFFCLAGISLFVWAVAKLINSMKS
jgi:hypothetical protein